MSKSVRRTDPITSWLADQDSQARRVPQRLRLLAAYAEAFPGGLTNAEAGLQAGMSSYSCYWKRCSELGAEGFIEPMRDGSGAVLTRVHDQTGSVQRVRRITDDGWNELRAVMGR